LMSTCATLLALIRQLIPLAPIIFLWALATIDYRCADKQKVGELRGDIGAI
jgi:hypothetical protein